MLVHDELQEITERPMQDAPQASDTAPAPTVGRRRWVAALIATGVLAGLAIAAMVAGSDQDPDPTSDVGSYDVVEANRLAVLRDLAAGSVGSYDVVEANRLAVLRDLAATP